MKPKKGRRVRKIEVPTDSVLEFELGDKVADILQMRKEREGRQERGRGKKSMQGQTKMKQNWLRTQRLEERAQISVTLTIQEGAHDQHIPEGLRLSGNCGLCKRP